MDFRATWKREKWWTEVDSCEIKVFWLHLLVAFRLFGAFWLLCQLYGFHGDGEFYVPLGILCTPKSNAELGSYRAFKHVFDNHDNGCQGNRTKVVFMLFGSKGLPSCKILLRSVRKHQR